MTSPAMSPQSQTLSGLWYQMFQMMCITERFFFLFSLMSLSRLFHSYRDEPIGRWGETGVPRENHLIHPQAELGLSHMWPVRGLEPTPDTAVR